MLTLKKQSPIYMCNVMYFRVKQNMQSNKNIAWDLAIKISTQPRSCKGKICTNGNQPKRKILVQLCALMNHAQ